uniref:Uncharacterized protein n=1 Tax=Arundo donax TaxID=35708 RepID=A0A0A9A9T0_ARUDO
MRAGRKPLPPHPTTFLLRVLKPTWILAQLSYSRHPPIIELPRHDQSTQINSAMRITGPRTNAARSMQPAMMRIRYSDAEIDGGQIKRN